jgi:hypothetical protein
VNKRDIPVIKPPLPEFFMDAVKSFLNRGSLVSALRTAQISSSIYPFMSESPELMLLRGKAELGLRHYSKARKIFQTVTDLWTADTRPSILWDAELGRIETEWRSGRNMAMTDLLSALEDSDPDADRLVKGLFYAVLAATDEDDANFVIELKDKMDFLDSGNEVGSSLGEMCSFYWLTGRYFFQKESWVEAADCFRRLGILGNGYEDAASFWKGMCKDRVGDHEGHDKIMKQLAEENPFSYYGLVATKRLGVRVPCDTTVSSLPGITDYLVE